MGDARNTTRNVSLGHLFASPLIPILVRQAADSGTPGRVFSGGVTVYEPRKTTVYRHNAVDLAGSGETTVDADFRKIELFPWFMAVLRRTEHALHVPRDYADHVLTHAASLGETVEHGGQATLSFDDGQF